MESALIRIIVVVIFRERLDKISGVSVFVNSKCENNERIVFVWPKLFIL